MNILTPIILMIILVYINIVFSYKYEKLNWLYETSHFIGGFFLAILFSNFLDKNLVLVAVLTAGIIWEVYELVINKNKKVKKYLENKFRYYIAPETFSESILDLLLDVAGAVFYLYLF